MYFPELPPGYYWKDAQSGPNGESEPGIRLASEAWWVGWIEVTRQCTRNVRVHPFEANERHIMPKTIHRNVTLEEGIQILTQMAWMGML